VGYSAWFQWLKIVLAGYMAALFVVVSSCSVNTQKELQTPPEMGTTDCVTTDNKPGMLIGSLKVLTLNMAHGRNNSLNQMLLPEATIRRNINNIAVVLRKASADIVALQEADGPSRWSGNFNQVAELARQANYPWYCRATHSRSWLFDFGTALLSRVNVVETLKRSFKPTPPTLTKGFLLGQFAWRPRKDSQITIPIDIVSVHLDFSRKSIEHQQVVQLSKALSGRGHPLIVLGDFNSEWIANESPVAEFATLSGLHAYHPEATNLGTYKSGKKRFDWILVSSELAFKSYSVLPEIVSDHQAVVAQVDVKPSVDIRTLAVAHWLPNGKACEGSTSCSACD
jgi:endonuclease/exonuclease/phosphatase family metal-dependent hydrolase